MDSGLAGSTVLVTGASGGLGTAIVEALAAEGANLVVHHHRGAERARALAHEVGPRTVVVGADLTDESQVDGMWRDAIAACTRIDALVVNAGIWITEPASVAEMSLAQWQRTLEVDLTSAFLTCRGFLRHLAGAPRDDASIVLIGSTAGLFGEADHADYASAKAGMMHGLLPSLKNEIVRVASRGRANAVAPGWILTKMAEHTLADPGAIPRVTRTAAMRKVARPEEVASVVAFLCSPTLASHVSGAVVPVHGGMEGRLLHE